MVQLTDNQRAGASRRRKRPSKLIIGLIIIFIVIVIVSVPILFLQLGSSQTLVILTIFSLWATVIIASLNLLIAYLQPHRALHQSDELRTSPDASVPLEAATILPPSSAPTTRELPLLADSGRRRYQHTKPYY